MAKEPVAGAVKTRLASALGADARAELYRAFLLDKVEHVSGLRHVSPYLAYTPEDAGPRMAALVGEGVSLVAQRGADLGERLASVADELSRRHDGVLLIDSDTPNLPSGYLDEAIRALQTSDVVLGPAWDGGYYLIGLRTPQPALFVDIPWSTSGVLRSTVTAARRCGLSIHFLPSWYDVDDPADLYRLADDLYATTPAHDGYARHTADLLPRLLGAEREHVARNEQWKTLATRRAYANRWTRVDENIVELPGGGLTLYGVVTCSDCVGIVPMLPDGRVLLVRQFRFVARRDTWEIPTGAANLGETLEDAAQRELREETGYAAGRLERLTAFHTSKSIMDETAYLYVADGLEPQAAVADETEHIEVRAFDFDDAVDMVVRGDIVDSMSVIALLLVARARSDAKARR